MNAKMSAYVFADEFCRVFGSIYIDDEGRVRAEDWPEYVRYDEETATAVLAAFPPMYGVTETGDSDVCAALDAAGARIEE
jgi:hypothetical protein